MAMKRVTYADVVDVRRVFDEVGDAIIEASLQAASDVADAYLRSSVETPLVEWGSVLRRDVALIAAADVAEMLKDVVIDSLRVDVVSGLRDWRTGLTTRAVNAIERRLDRLVFQVEISDLKKFTPRQWASVKGVGQMVYDELRRLVGDPAWPHRIPTPDFRAR